MSNYVPENLVWTHWAHTICKTNGIIPTESSNFEMIENTDYDHTLKIFDISHPSGIYINFDCRMVGDEGAGHAPEPPI